MTDMEMMETLWTLYPEEMMLLCVMTAICALVLSVCVIALAESVLTSKGEDELWED